MKTQMDEYSIPNATVSVVSNGEVVLKKGYGFADLEKHIPVEAEGTLFRLGSTSKVFTWTDVMQLVEQEKLDLNADVNTYLDFEIPSQIEKTSDESEPTPITLSHLMTHTPGLEDYSESIFRISEDKMLPLQNM
jgi:CubicO group peptidase (beta-lactamase class C family)